MKNKFFPKILYIIYIPKKIFLIKMSKIEFYITRMKEIRLFFKTPSGDWLITTFW